MGFARINSFWWSYFEISSRAKKRFQETFTLEKEPTLETNPDKCLELRDLRFEYGSQTIVFSAMTMESLINDFAAVSLGDSFFINHLDKLDILSKYVVITQLASQKRFPKEGQAFEHLKFLFSIRNNLIHPKSKPVPFKNGQIDSDAYPKMQANFLTNWRETVNKCYDTIKICADTLISIFPDEDIFLSFSIIVTKAHGYQA